MKSAFCVASTHIFFFLSRLGVLNDSSLYTHAYAGRSVFGIRACDAVADAQFVHINE